MKTLSSVSTVDDCANSWHRAFSSLAVRFPSTKQTRSTRSCTSQLLNYSLLVSIDYFIVLRLLSISMLCPPAMKTFVKPTSCLYHLLQSPWTVTSKLIASSPLSRPSSCIKKYCSFTNYAINCYQSTICNKPRLTFIASHSLKTSAVVHFVAVNPLERRDNYSVESNNMKWVQWLLMSGMLHLVQQGWDE